MRVVVLSDSHNNGDAIRRVLEQQPQASLFIHLGDGIAEFKRLMEWEPDKEFWCVRGNCDFTASEESTALSWIKDIPVLYTHGHQWNVRLGLEELRQHARERLAKIVLYGHTHIPHYHYQDGVIYLNPGSISSPRDRLYPTYATIDIQGKSIVCNHIEMKH